MNPLQRFYGDKPMSEAVQAFMIQVLRDMAADQAFKGVDVSGIRDANMCIDKTFDKLEEIYGKIEHIEVPNPR